MLDINTFKKKYDEQKFSKSKPVDVKKPNKPKEENPKDKGLTYEEIDNFSLFDDD